MERPYNKRIFGHNLARQEHFEWDRSMKLGKGEGGGERHIELCRKMN
jgi:hypothetical protein